MKTIKEGWIIEKEGEHLGLGGRTSWAFDWVPFGSDLLIVFPDKNTAEAFMYAMHIENAFVCEHGWYENENEI